MHRSGARMLVLLAIALFFAPAVHAGGGTVDVGGVQADGCEPSGGVGHGGDAAGTANGYHYAYAGIGQALVFGQDGCVDDATRDTSSFVFSAGSDDTAALGGTFLFARAGGVTITDPTPAQNSWGCTASGCTYSDLGNGLSCTSPTATPHHGADAKIFAHGLALDGGVSFQIAEDWARSYADQPPSPQPIDRLTPEERDEINGLDPTSDGGSQEGVLLQAYDFVYTNFLQPPPESFPPPPDPCGDGTIEPCPDGVDENDSTNPNFPQGGCNNLDHLWDQPAAPRSIVNSWPVTQAGATVNGVSVTDLGSIAGADGCVIVFLEDADATQVEIWTGN